MMTNSSLGCSINICIGIDYGLNESLQIINMSLDCKLIVRTTQQIIIAR